MHRARITFVVVASAALLLAACGGNSGGGTQTTTPPASTTTPPTTSPPAQTTSTLVLKDNVFDPSTLTVAAGATLTLKNEGAALHNFSVEGQGIDKDINPGETENEDLNL